MRLSDAAVALATIALGASGALAADAAALGATEDARLADLRYDVKIRMPSGKHPCEIEPNQDVVRAVQAPRTTACSRASPASPPRRTCAFDACEGEACDEACEASFAVPRTTSSPTRSLASAVAAPSSRASANPPTASRTRTTTTMGSFPTMPPTASLGNQRYFTLYDRCTTSADYLASHPVACDGITEQDGVDELEVKCLRPRFRDLFPAQCPHRPDGPMLVATDSCMPFVPEGAPRYLTLWDSACQLDVPQQQRPSGAALTEQDGCDELALHCGRRVAIQYKDECRPPSSAKRFAGDGGP